MEYRKTLREMRLYGMLTLPKTHYNATKVTMTHLKNMGEGVWSVVVSDAKYFTIDETNSNGEKLFKLVELVSEDKKFPQQKPNRIVGAIRIKERERVS